MTSVALWTHSCCQQQQLLQPETSRFAFTGAQDSSGPVSEHSRDADEGPIPGEARLFLKMTLAPRLPLVLPPIFFASLEVAPTTIAASSDSVPNKSSLSTCFLKNLNYTTSVAFKGCHPVCFITWKESITARRAMSETIEQLKQHQIVTVKECHRPFKEVY